MPFYDRRKMCTYIYIDKDVEGSRLISELHGRSRRNPTYFLKHFPISIFLYCCVHRAVSHTSIIHILPTNAHNGITCNMIYDMIYLLTAIGLSAGGSSTVHIYTLTIHRTIRNIQYIEQHNNFGRVRAVYRLG